MTSLSKPKVSSRVFLGSFVKAFGIKGELKFVGSDDFWPGVLDSKRLELQRLVDGEAVSRPLEIEKWRPHGNNHVIKIKGIDDRNGAEEEVGGELFVDTGRLDVVIPEDDLPYQLIGKIVKTEEGRVLGPVVSVIFSAAHPIYEVETDEGLIMIPAVPEFIIAKEPGGAVITIRTIPGLLDQ
jgi:16S rRNA processing protein RimM